MAVSFVAVLLCLEGAARLVASQSSFGQELLPRLLNEHRMNAEARQSDGVETELLFFGSSTSGADFDPTMLGDGAYDLWWAGAGTETMAAFGDAFALRYFSDADTVVVGITSRELNDARAEANAAVFTDAERSLAWRRVANDNLLTSAELKASQLSGLLRYRAHLRRPTSWVAWTVVDQQPQGLTTDDTGRLTRFRELSGAPMSEADLARERIALDGYTVGGPQIDGLRSTLDVFTSQDRRVVLVFLPVSDRYQALHPHGQADIDAARAAAEGAAADSGVEFLDLSDLVTDEQYYGDANHLNQRGSEILTQTVAAYLGLSITMSEKRTG